MTEDRLMTCVSVPKNLNECWVWNGGRARGYGLVTLGKGRKTRKITGAHRAIYELFNGPIPTGKVIDHLCRNKICVNPLHLEPVTQKENIQRGFRSSTRKTKMYCLRDHPLSGKNLYLPPSGSRECRMCRAGRRHKAVAV